MATSVLIIEDEEILARNMVRFLQRYGFSAVAANTGAGGIARARSLEPDVVILDVNLSDMVGVDAIAPILQSSPNSRIVMLTGHGSVEHAVTAMKAGAVEFLCKPITMEQLKLVIEKAVERDELERELHYFRERDSAGGLSKIVSESSCMTELKKRITQIVQADAALADVDSPAVLITGETGTGKELIARALHEDGPRRSKPFVELNCTTLPSHLIEAELFGYERGAFTDARTSKPGLVETAHGGTLFLDEIGDIEPALQAKLLKLLEDKSVRRVGSVRERTVDVRIVAATNRDLEDLVAKGAFRADLYFRLSVVRLKSPALRDRGGDVVRLAKYFLNLHAQRYRKPQIQFTDDAISAMVAHRWPGNVRELRNAIEQAVLLSTDDAIGAEDLHLVSSSRMIAGDEPADPAIDSIDSNGKTLDQVEKQLILDALKRADGNVTKAARLLGLSRDTLRYRMPKHGISRLN